MGGPLRPRGLDVGDSGGARPGLRWLRLMAAMVCVALQLHAPACQLVGFYLLPSCAHFIQALEPVSSQPHGVASFAHADNPGIFQHGQLSAPQITRALLLHGFGQLGDGEISSRSLQGIQDVAANLTQPLDSGAGLRRRPLAYLTGPLRGATTRLITWRGPPKTGGAQV